MSNTNKVRPGVDANIVEANTVRGHDAILPGNAPEDLSITPGRNNVDDVVALVTVWNRTDDRDEQVFDLRAGLDFGTANRAQVFVGDFDPNGITSGVLGSLLIRVDDPKLYQNTDGSMAWKVISDDSGGETLEETLALGNFTGNNPIVISDQGLALIQGEDSSDSTGRGSVTVRGGNETGVLGDGGGLTLSTGTSVGGNTGNIQIGTANQTGTGATGVIGIFTGNASGGGNAGFLVLSGGSGAQGAEINLDAGNGVGLAARGGRVQLLAGNSPSDGDGGSVNIVAGSATTPPAISNVFTPGEGGNVNIFGGNSAGTVNGGTIGLLAGDGGSGGADGGDVYLVPGAGGGGGDEGEVVATANFRSDNIKRGTSDPNVGGVSGDEGAIYQRTLGGLGQLWLNTNGTTSGWVQLAASGAFVESFVRSQYGTISVAGNTVTISAFGIFEGAVLDTFGGPSFVRDQDTGGPNLAMSVLALGDRIGPQITSAGTTANLQRQQNFIFAAKFSVIDSNLDYRGFVGISGSPLSAMVGSNNPNAVFIGLQKLDGLADWRFITRGTGVNIPAGQFSITGAETYWLIIDCSVDDTIVFLLIDSGNNIVKQASIDTTVSPSTSPTNTNLLRPVIGIEATANVFSNMDFYHCSAVTNADVLGGGGGAGGNPTLETVLATGNYTGANQITLTDFNGSFGGIISGETNPPLNIPDGGRVTISGGSTSDLAGTGGGVAIFSGLPAAGSAFKSGVSFFGSGDVIDVTNTGGTGNVNLSSGQTTGSGTSGLITLQSGLSTLGDTGNVNLTTGAAVAGSSGDVEIRTGNAIQAGLISLEGGDSSAGFGGNVLILGGDGGGAGTGAAGDIGVLAGNPDPASAFLGGSITLSGTAGATTGAGGLIRLTSGDGGPGGAAIGGLLDLLAGDGGSAGGVGGPVNIKAGDGVAGVSAGGDINLTPGVGFGGASDGAVIVNGKLTVTGLIDPTGLILTGQPSVPATAGLGDGLIWVDNTGAASALKFTNDLGATITVGGGGGGGDLATTLRLGNSTTGIPIKGSDNAAGSGGSLSLLGGSSTGAGGSGGPVNITAGAPDPGGSGAGGVVTILTQPGVDTGAGGDVSITTGAGDGAAAVGGTGGDFDIVLGAGGTNARGGRVTLLTGAGSGTGSGGNVQITTGNSGIAGGNGGTVLLATGDATVGSAGDGGSFQVQLGSGDGVGDGGSFQFAVGTGGGGGSDGLFQVVGDASFANDVSISGKLTVLGLIDPTGLLLTSQISAPFVPVGSDGGIWTNGVGDLIYTNGGGDVNLSTGGGGGSGNFLDSLLEAAYGMIGPGTLLSGILSSSSLASLFSTNTVSDGSDGVVEVLATLAANPDAEIKKFSDSNLTRTQQFKAIFKFALNGADTTQRFFAGLTDGPTTQLGSDDPVANQYVGIQTTLAGTQLQFVARGSVSALTPQSAIAADTAVHYLVVDASSTSQIIFTLLAADGVTVEATHTQASGTNIPSLATPMALVQGIHSGNGGAPSSSATTMDSYHSTVVCRADILPNIVSGSQNLATVLTTGNSSGGKNIVLAVGDSILGTSQGGNGGAVAVTAGASTGGGGNGGALNLSSGVNNPGGNSGQARLIGADAIGTLGDNGGAVLVAGGVGSTNAGGQGGFGGNAVVQAADGGTSTNAGDGGQGGLVSLIAGGGGVSSGTALDGGVGGAATLSSGAGGDTTVSGQAAGNAGAVSIIAEDGGDNAVGGDGGNGGTLALTSGAGGVGAGGAGNGGDAGNITLDGQAGGSPTGGGVPGDGADILITAGDAGSGGTADARGGQVVLQSGTPAASASSTDPGGVFISTEGPLPASFGTATTRIRLATTNNGANVGAQLIMTSATAGTGGGINLVPGGGAIPGQVNIGKVNPSAAGLQFSNAASPGVSAVPGVIDWTLLAPSGGPPFAFVVPFNSAFVAAPQNVEITLSQTGAPAVPGAITFVVHTVTAVSFEIGFSAAPPAGLGFYWRAFL